MTTLNVPGATPPAFPSIAGRIARRASVKLRSRTAWSVGLGLLSVASLVLVGAQVALANQRSAAVRVQTAWLAAQRIESGRTSETRRRAAIADLMKAAAVSDLMATAWDERRFGIRQATMSRKAANRLLVEITRSRGRLFAAEQFDLSVKDPKDGLFTIPSSPDTELIVTLRGTTLYRAKAEAK